MEQQDDLNLRRFEHEQKIQLEELALKQKELDLKIQEQRSKRVFTPLLLSIIGGLITIITGIVLKYYENQATLDLEDKKFQSSLLLKAAEARNYQEFSDIIVAFQENGLISLDSAKLANFRKKRFVAEKTGQFVKYDESEGIDVVVGHAIPDTIATIPHYDESAKIHAVNDPDTSYWLIIAGGDKTIGGAQDEVKKSVDNGFKDVTVFFRQNYYRTTIGKYASKIDAYNTLFDVKEKINPTSYVVRSDKWCANPTYDAAKQAFVCK